MKTVAELMSVPAVTVGPAETVATAVQRLREHDIDALPVTENGRPVGVVTVKDLLGAPPYRPVGEVMTKEVISIDPGDPVTTAFAVMDAHGIGRLLVVDAGTLVGIITRPDLLRELGKLTDPLTDLPWAGSLRQHAADLLKGGREIAVLFIDLDDFGVVNKLYGHVAGDRIIKAVSAALARGTEPALDFLCRYGGDEFAIVTIRDTAAAEALARALREAIVRVTVNSVPPGVVSGSLGIAGGKRGAERQDIHYEATVDDLITMASRASTVAKRLPGHILHATSALAVQAAAGDEERRVAIRRVGLAVTNDTGRAAVELEHEHRRVTGQAAGPARGMSGMRLLVEATLHAIRQFLPAGWDLALEEISRVQIGSSEALNVLLVSGTPPRQERLLGSAIFTTDPHEAAVKATLRAINRLLPRRLSAPSEVQT